MVAIEILSAGEWVRARFGVLSPSVAAAMVANLKERGTPARAVAVR